MSEHSPRVGLVLGAGGEIGGVYIRSALASLEDVTGWQPGTAVTAVGTSVGALNAARLADESGDVSAEAVNTLVDLAPGLPSPAVVLTDAVVHPLRRAGGRLVALLAPQPDRHATYAVAQPPHRPGVRIVTVQFRSGRRVVHDLAGAAESDAVLYASAAIPGAVAPVLVDGELQIDGAVWSPTNADLISPLDHDVLVVIAPMASRHGGSLLARTHRALLARELRPWKAAGKPVVAIVPDTVDATTRRSPEAFAEAARQAVLTAAK